MEAIVNYLFDSLPQYKRSISLPKFRGLMFVISLLTTAVIISIIIEHARVNENIETTSKYLKGAYKGTGKGADSQKAAPTEIARRVSATDSIATLEKRNFRLRTRLNDLEQILAKVELSASSSRSAYDRKGISLYLPRENSVSAQGQTNSGITRCLRDPHRATCRLN